MERRQRRLGAIAAHVTVGTAATAGTREARARPPQQQPAVCPPPQLQPAQCPPLTEAQLKQFLAEGALVLKVPEHEFAHSQKVYEDARKGIEEIRSLGGDYNINLSNSGANAPDRRFVWADLPEVSELCQAPTVVGALSSILGEGYTMHPHRAIHNNGGNRDQMFHKDGHHVGERDHRPRWIMGMWYPSRVTLDMGPSAVSLGSHVRTQATLQLLAAARRLRLL